MSPQQIACAALSCLAVLTIASGVSADAGSVGAGDTTTSSVTRRTGPLDTCKGQRRRKSHARSKAHERAAEPSSEQESSATEASEQLNEDSASLDSADRDTATQAAPIPAPAAAPQQLDTSSAEVSDPASLEPRPESVRTFAMELRAGAGLTQRIIDVPASQGHLTFDAGWAPALDVRAAGRLTGQHLFLSFRAAYQTSLGSVASDRLQLPASSTGQASVRSSHFDAGITPGLWLGAGPDSSALSLFLGYAVRAFTSVTELALPRFTLHGPVLRLELDVPLFGRVVSFHLAPEAQMLLSISRDLQRAGQLDSLGFAFGGEADLQFRIHARIALRLSYRESHGFASAAVQAQQFSDTERYIVAVTSVSY